MKKIFIKIFLIVFVLLGLWSINNAYAGNTYSQNTYLNEIDGKIKDKFEVPSYSNKWEWLEDFAKKIAETIKQIFYVIATIYFMIISIKLITSSNTEEELWNFKKGIIWISVWIVVMNLAVIFVDSIYESYNLGSTGNPSINLEENAKKLLKNLINPMIKLLEMWVAFFFILIMIFAFFRLVTASWDEEKAKNWKMTILYAVIWFIVVKIASELVFSVYGNCKWNYSQIANIFWTVCEDSSDLSWFISIITSIINWMNSFVAVIVIIMVIYIWWGMIFSNWNDEAVTKAKKSIIYIIIWVAILLFNYMILTFFL